MTSELARRIQLYVFYGQWVSRNGKSGPIIRLLHKKIIQGRHRFGKYVHKHFGLFLTALDSNPGWQVYFDDKGAGSPPNEYLVLVERGLRSFGDDIHAMGAKAMEQCRTKDICNDDSRILTRHEVARQDASEGSHTFPRRFTSKVPSAVKDFQHAKTTCRASALIRWPYTC